MYAATTGIPVAFYTTVQTRHPSERPLGTSLESSLWFNPVNNVMDLPWKFRCSVRRRRHGMRMPSPRPLYADFSYENLLPLSMTKAAHIAATRANGQRTKRLKWRSSPPDFLDFLVLSRSRGRVYPRESSKFSTLRANHHECITALFFLASKRVLWRKERPAACCRQP